mmetsp:Transcript_4089/g.9264  ORF Transcript_4089/g.9264 Transcript_4089/m.9264 type:complete len:111 (+) Transcript_4089:16-348(+)
MMCGYVWLSKAERREWTQKLRDQRFRNEECECFHIRDIATPSSNPLPSILPTISDDESSVGGAPEPQGVEFSGIERDGWIDHPSVLVDDTDTHIFPGGDNTRGSCSTTPS